MKKIFLVLIIIVLAVGAFFGFSYFKKEKNDTWVPIKVGKVIEAVYGLGRVTSDMTYNLKAGALRQIKKIEVTEGQRVTKDETLVTYHDGFAAKAPFAATVTALNANSYEIENYPQNILTLTNLDKRYILISLDQDAVLQINKEMAVTFSFDVLEDQKFAGKIEYIYSKDNNFFVKIIPSEKLPTDILPGMTSNVAIITKTIDKAQQIPAAALNSKGQITYKINNKIKTIKITPGVGSDDLIFIKSEKLPDGSQVLIKK